MYVRSERWEWLGLLGLVGLLGAGCGGQAGVVLDIGSWPEGAVTLRVIGTLDGVTSPEPLYYEPGMTRFVVQLPEGRSGQLALELAALDRDDCVRADAQSRVAVGGGLRALTEVAVPLAAVTPPRCRPPQLLEVTPGQGPTDNGTPLTLTLSGQGFQPGATVTVDGYPAANLLVSSSTQATFTLPSHPGAFGLVPVVLQNPDGQQASRSDLFSYYASQLGFPSATAYPADQMPRAVAVGDFNEDSYLDLTVANSGGTVSVLLNDRQGGFGPVTNFTGGALPSAVAVGDFNRDRHLDVAIVTTGSNSVSILLGNGRGGFGPPTLLPNISSSNGVALGDFNGDNYLDLAVCNYAPGKVSTLLGDGMGGFAAARSFVVVGTPATSVAVGDFDGDSRADLAVTVFSSGNAQVSVLLGDGSGGFAPATSYNAGLNSDSVAVGDVNGDKKADLVVSNFSTNDVSVLIGDGKGGFAPATNFPTGNGPYALTLGDINGDHQLDVAVANHDENTVSVLLGDGRGNLGPAHRYATGLTPYVVAIGDFNKDERADLVTANYGENNVSVLLNQSK